MTVSLVPGSRCAQGSDEDAYGLGAEIAAHIRDLVALSPNSNRLALDHALRICFSHFPAVKLVSLMIEGFV